MNIPALRLVLPMVIFATGVCAQGVPLTIPPDAGRSAISVVTDRGLTHTDRLPTRALRAARRAMNAGRHVDDDTLRALADRGDGLAAWRYVGRLTATGNPLDLAHYAAIAAGQGRVYALDDMIAAMRRLTVGGQPEARLKRLIGVLYAHAWAGNPLALDAVIEFNGKGRLLGRMSETTRRKILETARTMDGRVELRMAFDLLAAADPDEARARAYLDRARTSDNLAVMTTAQNLIAHLDAGAMQAGETQN